MNLSIVSEAAKDKMAEMSKKIVAASMWTIGVRIVAQSTNLLSSIILTRYLNPSDFGIVAFAFLVLSLITIVTDVGMKQNLIQHNKFQSVVDAAWTFDLVRSFIISILILVLARPVAVIFSQTESVMYIYAIAIIPIVKSIKNAYVVNYFKKLDFKKISIIDAIAVLVGSFCSITIVVVYHSPWCLVIGALVNTVIVTIGSYLICVEKVRLDFNLSKWRVLYQFGKWIQFSSWISYLNIEGEKYLVQFLWGGKGLGLYQMSRRFPDIISSDIKNALSSVLMPAFVKIKGDKDVLVSKFIESSSNFVFVLTSISLFMLILSDDLIGLVFKNEWLETLPIMKLLVIASLFKSVGISKGGIFVAIGKPSANLVIDVGYMIALLLFVSVFLLTTEFKIELMAASIVFAQVVSMCINLYCLKKYVGVPLKKYMLENVGTVIMIAITYSISTYIKIVMSGSLQRLLVLVVVVFILYGIYNFLFYKMKKKGLIAIFKRVVTQ